MANPAFDRAEFLRSLRLLLPLPDASEENTVPIIEVRIFGALPNKDAVIAGWYDADHLDKAAQDASPHAAKWKACYVTLNKVMPDLLARCANRLEPYAKNTTADIHILRRRWFLVDTDPKRLTGINSTDAEHAAALDKAKKIGKYLRDTFSFPDPLVADSGNGGHLLYRIDLPNDDASRDLIQTCLQSLAAKFTDSAVDVDTTTFNAARISKVYGTMARKGDDLPNRPQRLAKLLHVPQVMQEGQDTPVSLSALEALAATLPPKEPGEAPQNTTAQQKRPDGNTSEPFDMEGFIRENGIVTEAPETYQGGLRFRMDCPFNPDHKSPDAALYVTARGAAAFKCSHSSCSGNDWQAFRSKMAPAKPKPRNQKPRPAPPVDGFGGDPGPGAVRPTIITTDRPDRDIIADTWDAVFAANEPPQVYVNSIGAVRLGRDPESGRVSVEPMDAERMLHRLRRVADFVTVRQTKAGELETHVPPAMRFSKDMLIDTDKVNQLPFIGGVMNAPVLAQQGLLTAPGYHADAKLYLATEGLQIAPPNAPTQEDACKAFDRLFGTSGILGEFPYKTATDRANAAALLLTLFTRPYIGGNVPMFMAEAPEAGTGKTLLLQCIAELFEPGVELRDAPSSWTAEQSQAEWQKILVTALLSSPSVIFFDNIKGIVSSSALENLITGGKFASRILGTNTDGRFRTDYLTIVGTSNNPEASSDMIRRVSVIRLDADMDRPTDRQDFRISDLLAHVRANRAAIIGDVLTILSAWLAAGAKPGTGHKASFESWARTISGIFDFLGVEGFLAPGTEMNAATDPERAKWTAFAAAVHEAHGTEPKRAKELLVQAIEAEIVPGSITYDHITQEPTIHGEAVAARSLGNQIKRYRDRVFDGLKLRATEGRSRYILWSFVPVSKDQKTFSDSSGGNSSKSRGEEKTSYSDFSENTPGTVRTVRKEETDAATGTAPGGDPVAAFALSECVRGQKATADLAALLVAYQAWGRAQETKPTAYSFPVFGNRLAALPGVNVLQDGGGRSTVTGLALRTAQAATEATSAPVQTERLAPDEPPFDDSGLDDPFADYPGAGVDQEAN